MRSRYAAFALGRGDYLAATQDSALGPDEVAELTAWATRVTWLGLAVLRCEAGGPGDDAGLVEFEARSLEGGALVTMRETSTFVRRDGRWRYLAGTPTVTRRRPGRNEACPCGSGRKYKQCHA